MAKKEKKVVLGGEGHGAGDAGAVPVPAPHVDTTPEDSGDAAPDANGGANDDAEPDGGVGAATGEAPQPPAPSPEEKGGDAITEAVNEAFALHPMDRLYVTSDGQCFGNERHARNHARSLPQSMVETVERKTWGK